MRELLPLGLQVGGWSLAAEKPAEASNILSQGGHGVTLRNLQTLADIATENNSTIVFPLPLDFFRGQLEGGKAERDDPLLPPPARFRRVLRSPDGHGIAATTAAGKPCHF